MYDRLRLVQGKPRSGPLDQSETAEKQRQQKANQRYYLEIYYRLEGVEGNEDEVTWTWAGLLETCKLSVPDHSSY